MSANDILDVLNIQRDGASQPAKKKQKVGNEQTSASRQTGMARELYNLIGPNTPPINLSMTSNASIRDKINFKPSPWSKMPFHANQKNNTSPQLFHWVKGSKKLLEDKSTNKTYFFDKYNVSLDIPEFVDEETFEKFMTEIKLVEKTLKEEELTRTKIAQEIEEKKEEHNKEKVIISQLNEKENDAQTKGISNVDKEEGGKKPDVIKDDKESSTNADEKSVVSNNTNKEEKSQETTTESKNDEKVNAKSNDEAELEADNIDDSDGDWTYQETMELFELCRCFELKWHVIHDRFSSSDRSLEDLKEQFYKISVKILAQQPNTNPNLIESLDLFSKPKEVERKKYLESLLKRTPAEIAEEESLVIEARRFELAAKKMLVERSHLLTLLDSPQTSQSIQQYQSSQGLANLYNNLMILDKHQKKRQLQQQQRANASNHEPVPPPIPIAASSSFKKDRSFQTHLQHYLSGLLKQQQQSSNTKQEPSAIQQLLLKRLTVKEEEAYGLFYHAHDKLTPGVILRSTQKLPGLQQRQSVLKSVNSILQELDIPTAGGTSWKPIMPTRKTMAKYDELLRSVVALLEVKKGKDKLESEIRLIKSQRGLE